MPAEVALAPFEPTRRRRTPTAGAGLGLSIARGIVEAHGGGIELADRGRGTCFQIRLPVEMPTTASLPADGPPAAGSQGSTSAQRALTAQPMGATPSA
jgi:hypothetical protein